MFSETQVSEGLFPARYRLCRCRAFRVRIVSRREGRAAVFSWEGRMFPPEGVSSRHEEPSFFTGEALRLRGKSGFLRQRPSVFRAGVSGACRRGCGAKSRKRARPRRRPGPSPGACCEREIAAGGGEPARPSPEERGMGRASVSESRPASFREASGDCARYFQQDRVAFFRAEVPASPAEASIREAACVRPPNDVP